MLAEIASAALLTCSVAEVTRPARHAPRSARVASAPAPARRFPTSSPPTTARSAAIPRRMAEFATNCSTRCARTAYLEDLDSPLLALIFLTVEASSAADVSYSATSTASMICAPINTWGTSSESS
jgi:hypothetical protein